MGLDSGHPEWAQIHDLSRQQQNRSTIVSTDDEIQRYIEIGQANQTIIDLGHNWCRHLEVERFGGTGLIEVQTGLPIGYRSFSCQFASGSSMAGMDLKRIALEFARQHCEGCTRREPVSFPNWSQLLEEDAEQRRLAGESREAYESARSARAQERASSREAIRSTLAPQTAGILDLVGELDRENTREVCERLVAAARADPTLIDSRIQAALVELLEEGGGARSSASIVALSIARGCDDISITWALRLLARHEAVTEAADILCETESIVDDSLIGEALPALIFLATPNYHSFGDQRPPNERPLRHVFEQFPQRVGDVLRDLLRSPHVDDRHRACDTIAALLDLDPELAVRQLRDLIAAALLPATDSSLVDDPDTFVAMTLGHSLVAAPTQTETALQSHLDLASEAEAALLAHSYGNVLRRYPLRESEPDESDRIALSRLLQFSSRPTHPRALRAIADSLQSMRDQLTPLVAECASEVLGVAAILGDAMTSQHSDLSIAPQELQVLEEMNRRTNIDSIRSTLVKHVATAARAYPDLARAPYLDVLDKLDDDDATDLKILLVHELGGLVAGSESLSHVLPHLYRAMMSARPGLRAAGVTAFGEIARISGLDLPPLLLEAFLLALGDPYVIVHQSAVNALNHIHLPVDALARCHQILPRLLGVYRGNTENPYFMATLIEVFVDTAIRIERFPTTVSDAVTRLIAEMDPDARLTCLKHVGRQLRDSPGRFSVCLEALEQACRQDLYKDEILRVLRSSDPEIWQALAEDIVEVSLRCDTRYAATSPALIEGLSMAGCWREAHDLASRRLDSIPETRRDMGHRLWQAQFAKATAVELALCDNSDPAEAIDAWKAAKVEFEEHDAQARRSRPFSSILEKS